MKSSRVTFILIFLAASASVFGQGLTCPATAVPPVVHAEGVAERLGDIVLPCTGGAPGSAVTGNLAVFLNTNITNKLTSASTVDVALSIDTGSGPVLAGVPARLAAPNQIAFDGLSFLLPASGNATIRISGLRGDMTRLEGGPFEYAPARAWVAINGPSQIAVSNNQFAVGIGSGSLYSLTLERQIFCAPNGLRLPSSPTLGNLLAIVAPGYPVRVTEGFPSAFQAAEPGADNGVRVVVRLQGLVTGATIAAPDVVAGSTAIQPTSAGDFGAPVSAGQYAPSADGSLVLVRILDTDTQGAGGTPVASPSFGAFRDVPVAGGEALVVYEVADANATVVESAQIPLFFGWQAGTTGELLQSVELQLGPVSTTDTASAAAPVPRFVSGSRGTDCGIVGDCGGSYLPRVSARPDRNVPLEYTGVQGGEATGRFVIIRNETAEHARWQVSAQYKNGSGWLRFWPDSGVGRATVRVDAVPAGLEPGIYEATMVVDAGLGGQVTLPIKLTVGSVGSGRPHVSAALNAATSAPGPLVRGSFASLMGSFAGQQRSVTFDGVAAQIVYQDAYQINLRVPTGLTPRTSAQMIVSVDGVFSTPRTVTLASAAPGIFPGGVLNQDNSVNTSARPAGPGSVIQIFASGLLPPEGGTVHVRLQDRVLSDLEYAGEAPGIPGLQQVNVSVPAGLTGSIDLQVCNAGEGQPVCSPAVKLYVQ